MSLYSQRCAPICLVLLEGMSTSAFSPPCLECISENKNCSWCSVFSEKCESPVFETLLSLLFFFIIPAWYHEEKRN